MRHRKGIAALALGASLLCLPAFSQEESVGRSEVSVQMFGTFTRNTVQDGINQASRNSGGILASYRFFFADHQGNRVSSSITAPRAPQRATTSAAAWRE